MRKQGTSNKSTMTLFPRIPHWCKPSIPDLIETLPKHGKFLFKYTNMCNLEVVLCKSSQQKTLKQVLRKSWFWVEDLLSEYISHPIPLSFLGSPRARFLHWWYQPITSQPRSKFLSPKPRAVLKNVRNRKCEFWHKTKKYIGDFWIFEFCPFYGIFTLFGCIWLILGDCFHN